MKKIEPQRHPSGKPVRNEERRGWVYPRAPLDGPMTPRLKRGAQTYAVGFLADHIGGDRSAFARKDRT